MIERKYSTFWPRLCAGILDGFVFWPLNWLCSFTYSHSTSAFVRVLLYVVSSSAFLFYSIWMHGKYGQTLGKMACKVIVLDVSEKPLRMKQAVLRDILSIVLLPIAFATDIPRLIHGVDIYAPDNILAVDWIVAWSVEAWFLIEIITMFTNSKRRALHDFIAGSVVIRKPEPAPEPALPGAATPNPSS